MCSKGMSSCWNYSLMPQSKQTNTKTNKQNLNPDTNTLSSLCTVTISRTKFTWISWMKSRTFWVMVIKKTTTTNNSCCHSCFFKASFSVSLDCRQKAAQFRFKEQNSPTRTLIVCWPSQTQQLEAVPLCCSSSRLPAEGSGGQSCLRRGGGGGWEAEGGRANPRGEEADRSAAQLWLPAPCKPLQWF